MSEKHKEMYGRRVQYISGIHGQTLIQWKTNSLSKREWVNGNTHKTTSNQTPTSEDHSALEVGL